MSEENTTELKLYAIELGKISTPLFIVATNFDEAREDAKIFATNSITVTGINEIQGKLHIDFGREVVRINNEFGVESTITKLKSQCDELHNNLIAALSDLKYVRGQSFKLSGFNEWLEKRCDILKEVVDRNWK